MQMNDGYAVTDFEHLTPRLRSYHLPTRCQAPCMGLLR
jgi:hypothetical protein